MKTAWTDTDMDLLTMLLTILFGAAVHGWTMLVLWAEARATRTCVIDRPGTRPAVEKRA